MKIYITGLSGTGKTSIVEALLKKGIRAIDIDDDSCHWENKHTNEHTEWHPGKDDEWHRKHIWLCDIEDLGRGSQKQSMSWWLALQTIKAAT